MTSKRTAKFLMALLGCCSIAPAAFGAAISEITVTAQFREQGVQDVPIAITALSGSDLEDLGIKEFRDLLVLTPGVTFTGFSLSNPGIAIRGVSGANLEIASEPAVALYVDGVYRKRNVEELLDLERVEILKGPQGTLYGRNTTAGVFNFITKKPTDTLTAQLEIQAGNFDTRNIRGYVSGPLADNLAAKVNFSTRRNDHYADNLNPGFEFRDNEQDMIRSQVLFTPNESMEFTLSGDYERNRTPGSLVVPVKTETIAFGGRDSSGLPIVVPVTLFDPTSSDPSLNPTGNIAHGVDGLTDVKESDNTDEWGVSLNGKIDLGFANLTSITAYRDFEQQVRTDVDGTPCAISAPAFIGEFFRDAIGRGVFPPVACIPRGDPFLTGLGLTAGQWAGNNRINSTQFSQEVRLASSPSGALTFNNRLNWTIGFYYYHENSDQLRRTDVNGVIEAHAFTNDLRLRSLAGFAQGTFAVTDRFNATIGVRYTHESKNYLIGGVSRPLTIPHPFIPGASLLVGAFDTQPQFDFANFPFTFQSPPGGGAPVVPVGTDPECAVGTRCIPVTPASDSFNSFDPKFSLDYHVTEDVMVYASAQRGFKSGGFNGTPVSIAVGIQPYAAERVWAYEGGFKSDWFDGRLRINATGFYYDYKNEQIFGNFDHDNNIATPNALIFRNAKKSKKTGAELQVQVAVSDRLNISGSYSYLRATYGDFPVFAGPVEINNFKGNTALRSPRHSASISVAYVLPLAEKWGDMTVRVDGNYRSKEFFTPENNMNNTQKGYDVWNTSLFYEPNESWRVTLWAKNVFDEGYFTQKFQAGAPTLFLAPGTVSNPGFFDAGRERATGGLPRRFGVTLAYRFGG